LGPDTSDSRVVRGGSFRDDEYDVRSTERLGWDPSDSWENFGFRCARSP
jgi:formylglycine-generating enzyme required for sulfatase activity